MPQNWKIHCQSKLAVFKFALLDLSALSDHQPPFLFFPVTLYV